MFSPHSRSPSKLFSVQKLSQHWEWCRTQTWLSPHWHLCAVAICQGVIRQVFRQIYKSLLEPTFEGSFKMCPDKCLCHRSLGIYKCWVSGFSFFWCCPQLHGTSGHRHVRCHSSGQIWFVKLGGGGFFGEWVIHQLVKVNTFQTCLKPRGIYQTCFSYPSSFLPLDKLLGPFKKEKKPCQYLCKSVHLRETDGSLIKHLSSATFLWRDSQKPLTRLRVIRSALGVC